MKKLDLFLFGAGASYGARSVDSPPLGANLHHYVLDYLCLPKAELGILEEPADGTRTEETRLRLKELLKSANSYEQLVTQLRQNNEVELLKKLNLLMAYALTPPRNDDPRKDNAFVEKADLYDDFLNSRFLNRAMLQTACFITLNYDCLLERALCRCYHCYRAPEKELRCLCTLINYQLSSQRNDVDRIEVLKPHGSINWVADVTGGDAINITDPAVNISQDNHEEYCAINAADSPQHKSHAEIVVACYAPEKYAQINRNLLKKIRELSLKRISQSTTLTIIGVHIPGAPSDDPFLHEFLDVAGDHARNGLRVYFIIDLCVNNKTLTATALRAGPRRAQMRGACPGNVVRDGCFHAG